MAVRFTRSTVHHAANLIGQHYETQGKFDNLMLEFGLDDITGQYVREKVNSLIRSANAAPGQITPDGRPLADAIVETASLLPNALIDEKFNRALNRDGYELLEIDGKIVLQAMMPPVADLATASDEVHLLLDTLGMLTAKGHLDQGIENHGRGNWAAANSQLRTFTEDMFNEIARRLAPEEAAKRTSSENLRQLLFQISPPFFSGDLGEWSTDGKNFINGLFKRLHGHGSHPGLSEEDDCTVRLHIVLVLARHYLRRCRDRLSGARPQA